MLYNVALYRMKIEHNSRSIYCMYPGTLVYNVGRGYGVKISRRGRERGDCVLQTACDHHEMVVDVLCLVCVEVGVSCHL